MTSSIDIKRRKRVGNRYEMVTIASVPVTSDCLFVSELMREEYVRLKWRSDTIIDLRANDRIEYNGKTYLIDEVADPTISSAGGFEYEQTFYIGWYLWKNYKLIFNRSTGGEAGWKMTNTPGYFLQFICDLTEYTYQIDGEFTEMKLCDFSSSMDIVSALNLMADDSHWRTEWWVDSVNKVIHFGSCLLETKIDIDDDYINKVSKQSTSNKYYSRLYAFGSTRNISQYYRKDLVFEVGDASALQQAKMKASLMGYSAAVVDSKRPITSDVFLNKTSTDITSVNVTWGTTSSQSKSISFLSPMGGAFNLSNTATSNIVTNLNGVASIVSVKSGSMSIRVDGSEASEQKVSVNIAVKAVDAQGNNLKGVGLHSKSISINLGEQTQISLADVANLSIGKDKNEVYLLFTITLTSEATLMNATATISNVVANVSTNGVQSTTLLTVNNNTYEALCFQRSNAPGEKEYNSIILYNGEQANVGDEFYLTNLAEYELPVSYFTQNNGAVEMGVADNRLMLPRGIDCVEVSNHPNHAYREGILVLDDIYPRMKTTITSVGTRKVDGYDDTTGIDKSFDAYQIQYSGITFKEKYILPEQKLHIIFQTGQLAGMDFEVQFNPDYKADEESADAQKLEIVRNENYGLPIPNDNMKPNVNDEFILYGFNTTYVDDALVANAEQELLEKATEVVNELQKDSSNYDCDMNVIRCLGYKIVNGKQTKVGEDITNLPLGTQIEYSSDIYGTIQSRVRKIERSLDMQTLKYTLGISAPYSRYRELQTLINKIK